MSKPRGFVGAALRVALLAGTALFPAVAWAAPIEWRNGNQTIQRTMHDEDLTVALRWLLEQDGLGVFIRPGVKGSVTTSFTNMPLRGAFQKLIEENGLDYDYDPGTRTVTISVQGQSSSDFIALRYLNKDEITSAVNKFGRGVTFVFDDANKLVLFRGDAEQVRKLKEMVLVLEKRQEEKARQFEETARSRTDIEQKSAEADQRRAQTQLIQAQTASVQRMQTEIQNISVKVIPLHSANVGPVKLKFQGEEVTIPGLIDTLNNLLGVATSQADTQSSTALRDEFGRIIPKEQAAQAGAAHADPRLTQVVRNDPQAFHGSISADLRTNSVIVRGTPTEIEQVKALVASLDKAMEQVEIEAIIAKTTLGTLQRLGVRWGSEAYATNRQGKQVGVGMTTSSPTGSTVNGAPSLGATAFNSITAFGENGVNGGGRVNAIPGPGLVSPLSLLPTAASTGTVASLLYRGGDWALSAELNALIQDNKAHILSAPRVVTLDNVAAKITSDRTVWVPTSAGVGSAGAFEKIPAGLTLKITPSVMRRADVGEDNMIRLVIESENTQVAVGAGGSTKSGATINTQVVIPDSSTFVMGGLTDDQRDEGVERVPLLSDVPLLGELFKVRNSNQGLEETLFFITPRLVPRADLYNKDVAQKRYLQSQHAEMERVSADVRSRSQLLNLNTRTQEEDE